ncbi:MAG: alkaline phosphatase D family protein [Phycisphaerae bacterium]
MSANRPIIEKYAARSSAVRAATVRERSGECVERPSTIRSGFGFRPDRSLTVAALKVAFFLSVLALEPLGRAQFSLGVTAGDVTDQSAILWTRADRGGPVRAEIGAGEDFSAPERFVRQDAAGDSDFTIKVTLDALHPATTYFYRFVRLDDGAVSAVGRFRTAPAPDTAAELRFVFSGDTNFAFAPFGVFSAAANEGQDLTVWFGDTIYSDVPAGDLGVAATRADYRAKYRQIRGDAGVQAAAAASAVLVGWDDHEVTNDYAGRDPELSAARREDAYRAFFEYMPIRDLGDAADPFRTYRRVRHGANVEFFMLDERQYRDVSAREECGSNPDPDGFLLGPLTADRNCVDALRRPREMFGAAQFEWLKQGLLESTARWKFVINNVPLTYIGVLPYDRWDGYDAQRRDLLRFIDDNAIPGVVFLTTDIHANAFNPDLARYFRRARPDYGLRGSVPIVEVIAGPLGNATMRESVRGFGEFAASAGAVETTPGPLRFLARSLPGLLERALDFLEFRLRFANGLTMIQTDRVAYVVIDVDEDGAANVTYRGAPPGASNVTPAEVETFAEIQLDARPGAGVLCPLSFLPVLLAPFVLTSANRNPDSRTPARSRPACKHESLSLRFKLAKSLPGQRHAIPGD